MSVDQIQNLFDRKELQIKMSSVMLFTFNAVELSVVTINDKPWARAKGMCRALEYDTKTSKTADIIRAHCCPENITQKYQMAVVAGTIVTCLRDLHTPDLYIIKEGICELLVRRKQPLAKELS